VTFVTARFRRSVHDPPFGVGFLLVTTIGTLSKRLTAVARSDLPLGPDTCVDLETRSSSVVILGPMRLRSYCYRLRRFLCILNNVLSARIFGLHMTVSRIFPPSSTTLRFARILFGYDFFISFKLGAFPLGAQSYASDLARRLREDEYTVFFSEEEAPPGAALDATLVRALRRARILIVIINEGALLHSQWVRKEVEQFRTHKPKAPIIAIDIDRSLDKFGDEARVDNWLGIQGRKWLDEPPEAHRDGIATDRVVESIRLTPTFIRASRWFTSLVVAVFAIIVAAASIAFYQRNEARTQQIEALKQKADALRQRDLALFSTDSVRRVAGPISGRLLTIADDARQAIDSDSALDQANTYLNFGEFHLSIGDPDRAKKTAELAERVFSALPPGPTTVNKIVFKIRINELKGDIASLDRRNFGIARQAYDEALANVEALDPQENRKTLSRIRVLRKRARLAVLEGDWSRADQILSQVLKSPQYDQPDSVLEIARCEGIEGESLYEQGLQEQAGERFQKAAGLFEDSMSSSTDRNSMFLDYAFVLQRIGDVQRNRGLNSAIKSYERSIGLLRRLNNEDETSVDATRGLDFAYQGIRLLGLSKQAELDSRAEAARVISKIDLAFGEGIGEFRFGMNPLEVNQKLKAPVSLMGDFSNMADDVGFQTMPYIYKELHDEPSIIPFGFTDKCLREAGYVVFLFHEHKLLRIAFRFMVSRGKCPQRDYLVDAFAEKYGLDARGAQSERSIKFETSDVALNIYSDSYAVTFEFTQR
jgi:tetratricopeptide (TPR) repeat protein